MIRGKLVRSEAWRGLLRRLAVLALAGCAPAAKEPPPQEPSTPLTPEAQLAEAQKRYPAVAAHIRDSYVLGGVLGQLMDDEAVALDLIQARISADRAEILRHCPRTSPAACPRINCRLARASCDFSCQESDTACQLREIICRARQGLVCVPT